MRLRNLVRGAGLTLGALGLLSLNPAPLAHASHGVTAAAQVQCKEEASSNARSAGGKGRGGRDHEAIPAAQLRTVEAKLAETARKLRLGRQAGGAQTSPRTGPSNLSIGYPVYINVYVHNIYGSHPGERDIGNNAIKTAIARMNLDYSTGEYSTSAHSRYRFRLASIALHRNDAFYHAEPDTSADIYWRRQYHRGGKRDLNIYIRAMDGGYGKSTGLLGFATFPWNVASSGRLDSVNVHPESLPNRQLTHYNEGDTMTHETGHWLGLLHPFEGGCSGPNDYVADTPPQVELNACPRAARTCLLSSGLSNPSNYMQYTYDSCMRTFTRGQVTRMDNAWVSFRQ